MLQEMTIAALLEAQEGEGTQFKEAKRRFDFEEAARICCALANGNGGRLVLGISDKRPRGVVGSEAFPQPERTRAGLMDKLKTKVDFQLLYESERRVLVFDVAAHPVGLPVQVDGVAWWYNGDTLERLPESERHRIYEEAGVDFSARVCPGATLEDLDEDAIEVFRKRWMEKSGNARLASLSQEQLLRDAAAVESDGVTYAALVLFGRGDALRRYLSQAEIVFEYRASEASGPAAQRVEFREAFFKCYDELWALVNLRNNKQHYQEGLFVFDILTFNERVVREALLNAVSHRNYQMAGSVFLRQYPDKLVIESPGGLPIGVTMDNILDRQSPRNRRIAELLALCGLVERSGQGMNLMVELSIREAKALPDFSGTDAYNVVVTLHGLILDERMLSVMSKIGNERLENMTTADFILTNDLFHERDIQPNLQARLVHLLDLGIVENIGHGQYVLARSLYEAAGRAGVHTRKVGLDHDTNKALLLKHIRENGEKGTPLKELNQVLPTKSRSQLQRMIRELQDEGKIYCVGKTRGARWFLTHPERPLID